MKIVACMFVWILKEVFLQLRETKTAVDHMKDKITHLFLVWLTKDCKDYVLNENKSDYWKWKLLYLTPFRNCILISWSLLTQYVTLEGSKSDNCKDFD